MGSSESKTVEALTLKPDQDQRPKNVLMAQLIDPRSPTCGIDRTPIQVSKAAICVHEVQESAGAVCVDPRSPSPGIIRTPMKDSMKVTVCNLARQLSSLLLNDVQPGKISSTLLPSVSYTKHPNLDQQIESSSKQPLLPSNDFQDSPSRDTEASSTVMEISSFCSTPFVLVEEAHLQGGMDISLERAEEAEVLEEFTLKKELACDDVCSPDVYCSDKVQHLTSEEEHDDHLYAVSYKPAESSAPIQGAVMSPLAQPPEQEEITSKVCENVSALKEKQKLPTPELADASSKSSSTYNQSENHMHGIFPTLAVCSPSQVVFKPQWLAVGFGTTGVRARGLQGRDKGMSSPLSIRKPVIDENDNKVVNKLKHRAGKAHIGEGRSPLQVLKETNLPRYHTAQMKLNTSTPEKQNFTQTARRGLVLLNKENQLRMET